jgi:two-component system, response regulator PdtaR
MKQVLLADNEATVRESLGGGLKFAHETDAGVGRCAERPGADEGREARPVPDRILVVDDDPSVREMLTRVLAGEGYVVLGVKDGAAALRTAVAAKINLVLLDLKMPGKSGWDTFERLTTENPLLAVVVITALPNQLFTAKAAGVGALLEKPLNFPELLQIISRLLSESAESRLARLAGNLAFFRHVQPERGGLINK